MAPRNGSGHNFYFSTLTLMRFNEFSAILLFALPARQLSSPGQMMVFRMNDGGVAAWLGLACLPIITILLPLVRAPAPLFPCERQYYGQMSQELKFVTAQSVQVISGG